MIDSGRDPARRSEALITVAAADINLISSSLRGLCRSLDETSRQAEQLALQLDDIVERARRTPCPALTADRETELIQALRELTARLPPQPGDGSEAAPEHSEPDARPAAAAEPIAASPAEAPAAVPVGKVPAAIEAPAVSRLDP